MIFTSDEVTIENHWQIASRVTQKSLSTVTNVLFYFLHAIYVLNTKFRQKQLSITDFAIVAKDGLFWLNIVTSPQLICDVTRTWGTGIVTSYSSIVLARANWHKGELHLWKTTVNIDFSSPSIHGLVCKKSISYQEYDSGKQDNSRCKMEADLAFKDMEAENIFSMISKWINFVFLFQEDAFPRTHTLLDVYHFMGMTLW